MGHLRQICHSIEDRRRFVRAKGLRAISGEREDFEPLRPRETAYGVIVRRERLIICKNEGRAFGKTPGLPA